MLTFILLQVTTPDANQFLNTHGNQFFTTESLVTFAGASAITFLVANGIQRAFGYNPKWLALVIAILVCLLAVYIEKGTGVNYVIGVINGFLVFNTAAGATNTFGSSDPDKTDSSRRGGQKVEAAVKVKRKFLSSWS